MTENSPISVLWVEDEPSSMRWEQIKAKGMGWEITHVTSTAVALECLTEQAFQVVVLDMILPEDEGQRTGGYVDPDAGLRLLERIRSPRRHGRTPADVPIAVITAVMSLDKRSIMEKHVSKENILSKAVFKPEEYLTMVRRLTEHVRAKLNPLPQARPEK